MMDPYARWPKVELHRHIEGSMRLGTFKELAAEAGLALPGQTEQDVRPLIELQDGELGRFDGFLRTFSWLRRVIRNPAALERVTYEAIADAAAERTVYLELRFNPGAMFLQGMGEAEVAAAIRAAVGRGKRDFGLRAGVIGIVGRDMPADVCERTVGFCIRYFHNGIDAIDLAGNEAVPPEGFAPLFQRARQAGLPITIHAGETAGARNIVSAVRLLGAKRIGHGARLFESGEAVRCVLEEGVAIEACLTSNLHTGAVARLPDHPLRRMLAAGIPVSLNTDDPRVSRGLTLAAEYRAAVETLGISQATLQRVIQDSVEQGFLPEAKAWAREKMAFA